MIGLFEHSTLRSFSGKNYRIFLLTASTGDPHPSASGTYIFTHTLSHERRLGDIKLREDIMGVVFSTSDSNETEIAFWNWKTGSLLGVSWLRLDTVVEYLPDQNLV